jgi:hypothetical protein
MNCLFILKRARAVLLLGCIVWLALIASASVGHAQVTIQQTQLGNIFTVGQTPSIGISSSASSVAWSAKDVSGNVVASGSVNPKQTPTLTFPSLPLGCFEIDLNAGALGTAQTTLALLPSMAAYNNAGASQFGVQTHFAQGWSLNLIPLLVTAGLHNIRDEQYWATVETTKGVYQFPPTYTAYMRAALINNITPLAEMDFGNALYDNDGGTPPQPVSPYTAQGRAGYASYGQALLQQYGGEIKAVEIWNEYNGSFSNGPATANLPFYYTAMLAAAYQAIKAKNPAVAVLGGAGVLVPLGYYQNLFALGALQSMDAIVIHPYTDTPTGLDKVVYALRDLMGTFGTQKPIWATECGTSQYQTLAREGMAGYLVQLDTLLLAGGAQRIYWYQLMDDQSASSGLLRGANDPHGAYIPTAAYAAYANLLRQLYIAPFVREEVGDARDRVFLFNRQGVPVRICWTTKPPVTLTYATSGAVQAIDVMGNPIALTTVNGTIQLPVGSTPIYLTGNVTLTGSSRTDTVLADSIRDMVYTSSATQGANHWFYGSIQNGQWTPMQWTLLPYGYEWLGGYANLEISLIDMQPSSNGTTPVWAVRRWQSTYTGQLHIQGTAQRPSAQGDGTTLNVLVNGQQIQSFPMTPAQNTASFDFTTSAKFGDLIDFAMTPGPAADSSFDATNFYAQILAP